MNAESPIDGGTTNGSSADWRLQKLTESGGWDQRIHLTLVAAGVLFLVAALVLVFGAAGPSSPQFSGTEGSENVTDRAADPGTDSVGTESARHRGESTSGAAGTSGPDEENDDTAFDGETDREEGHEQNSHEKMDHKKGKEKNEGRGHEKKDKKTDRGKDGEGDEKEKEEKKKGRENDDSKENAREQITLNPLGELL